MAMGIEDIRFSQRVTFGNHLYRHNGDVAEIIFENTKTGIKRMIVDDDGRIQGFPGIAHPDVVSAYCKGRIGDQIRYRTEIREVDGQYALVWQIQPDGEYWQDGDGFGRNMDDEIDLYARLDENGNFIEPFRLYEIGVYKFYNNDTEEKIAKTLRMEADPLACLKEHIPKLIQDIRECLTLEKEGEMHYDIPGTVFEATLALFKISDKWMLEVGIGKKCEGSCHTGFLEKYSSEEEKDYLSSQKAIDDVYEEMVHLYNFTEA